MCLAVPGKVTELWDKDGTRMAKVDSGGLVKDVCAEFVPDLEVGDYTIVHVGYALQRIDERSAMETLALLEQLGGADLDVIDEPAPDQATRAGPAR